MAILTNTVDDASMVTAIGGAPANGDSVYIARNQKAFTSADLSAADLLVFEVGPDYRQDLSSIRNRLVVNQLGAGVFRYSGSGRIWNLESTGSTGKIVTIWHTPAAGATLNLFEMDTETVLGDGGTVILHSGCDCDSLLMYDGRAHAIGGGGFGLPNATLRGASILTSERSITTALKIYDGARAEFADDAATIAGATIDGEDATLRIVDSGTITTLTLHDGLLDLYDLNRPLTITNSTLGHVRVRSGRVVGGARIRWPKSGKDLITFANPPTLLGEDPRNYGA